eukprot:2236273-Alexandrium_andersonii.AAC.1
MRARARRRRGAPERARPCSCPPPLRVQPASAAEGRAVAADAAGQLGRVDGAAARASRGGPPLAPAAELRAAPSTREAGAPGEGRE